MTIEGVTLGIDQKEAGVIAEILVEENTEVAVGKSIAVVVNGSDEYEAYTSKYSEHDETAAVTEDEIDQALNMTMIKQVKQLIRSNAISEEDNFAHDLLSLCRQKNADLVDAFDASFDGDEFNDDTFDAAFFIDNARSIVAKHKLDGVST